MNKKIFGYALVLVLAVILFIRIANGSMEHPFKSVEVFGVWIAAFLTLAIMSFLYNDNPLYRVAEHLFIGVSAAYWMTVGFWTTLVPNLLGKLDPEMVRNYLNPGYGGKETHWQFIIPLVLGIMLIMRLSSKIGWISRWPLAFIFGATAGMRFVSFLDSDFISQIRATIIPLVSIGDQESAWAIFQNSFSQIVLFLGVVTGLIYFFFSKEHKGLFGKASRVGIWVLMITFGAGFGYTVMGRVALLVGRMEFLFRDWLNIVQ